MHIAIAVVLVVVGFVLWRLVSRRIAGSQLPGPGIQLEGPSRPLRMVGKDRALIGRIGRAP